MRLSLPCIFVVCGVFKPWVWAIGISRTPTCSVDDDNVALGYKHHITNNTSNFAHTHTWIFLQTVLAPMGFWFQINKIYQTQCKSSFQDSTHEDQHWHTYAMPFTLSHYGMHSHTVPCTLSHCEIHMTCTLTLCHAHSHTMKCTWHAHLHYDMQTLTLCHAHSHSAMHTHTMTALTHGNSHYDMP